MRWTFVLALAILAGCAQVGRLTGGDRDTTAPKPLSDKTVPANQTVNFSGNQIKITFDEYVSLNKPNENLIVVPPNIQPKVEGKGKVVIISWEDTLLPNTTYAFYLNGLIKDVTEGNDSLMTHVFSTGPKLDSLVQAVYVSDVETGQPLKKMTVGLYRQFADTLKPTYFAETDEKGLATLRYMKAGQYQLLTFFDANRNLLLEPNEVVGFLPGKLSIEPNKQDTIGLVAFSPEKTKRISTFEFIPPAAFRVGAPVGIEKLEFQVNGQIVDTSQIHRYEVDSLSFYVEAADTNVFELTVSGEFIDTNRLRFRSQPLVVSPKLEMLSDSKLKPREQTLFWAPGKLTKLQKDSITVMRLKDSVKVDFTLAQEDSMTFKVLLEPSAAGKHELTIKPKAIKVAGVENSDTLRYVWTMLAPEELGNIIVACSGFEAGSVVQVLYKGQLVKSQKIKANESVTFKQMTPGQYTFRILLDENKNGVWDTGSLREERQAERFILFEKAYSLRANWDLEVELQNGDEPQQDEQ